MPLPFLIPAIGTGIGAISNAIFGGSKTLTDEQIAQLMATLPKYNDEEARNNLERRVAAYLKNRQLQTSQKNASMGINDAQAVYSADEPIFNARADENNKISELKANDEKTRAETLAKLKMEKFNEDNNSAGVVQRALEGGIGGFSLGSKVSGLMGKMLPKTDVTNNISTDAANTSGSMMNTMVDSPIKLDDNFANPNPVTVPTSTDGIDTPENLDNNGALGDLGNSDAMNNLAKKKKITFNQMRNNLLNPYGIG